MCGPRSNQHGFSLIEILVVITIGAILAAVVIPNLGSMSPYYERERFITRLNGLVQFAWRHALTSRLVTKVDFHLGKREIQVTVQKQGAVDSSGEPVFEPIKTAYLSTKIMIPEQIDIKQFFIEGFDEMSRFSGKSSAEVWFYVVPNGLTQLVTINFLDTKNLLSNKPRPIGLVLNPFNAQFAVHETFQKG